MDLREALLQISEIRSQMARTQVFRGYRSATSAFSGIVAIVAATLQSIFLPHPLQEIGWYIALWCGSALLCVAMVGVEMIVRTRKLASPAQSQLTLLAVEQFLPSLVAGALLTAVLVAFLPQAIPMLPGLWLIFFGLGVFASCRLLPRTTFIVAGFYLLAGMAVLMLAQGPWTLHPFVMGVPFGIGQFLAAGILYHQLERGHE